jgi:hypothetical protein
MGGKLIIFLGGKGSGEMGIRNWVLGIRRKAERWKPGLDPIPNT